MVFSAYYYFLYLFIYSFFLGHFKKINKLLERPVPTGQVAGQKLQRLLSKKQVTIGVTLKIKEQKYFWLLAFGVQLQLLPVRTLLLFFAAICWLWFVAPPLSTLNGSDENHECFADISALSISSLHVSHVTAGMGEWMAPDPERSRWQMDGLMDWLMDIKGAKTKKS